MKRRQESIIYQLAVSEGPLTTDELAKRLSVSATTVGAFSYKAPMQFCQSMERSFLPSAMKDIPFW